MRSDALGSGALGSGALRRLFPVFCAVLLSACYDGDPSDFRESVVVGREQVTGISVSAPVSIIETGATIAVTATATTATGPRDVSALATWRSSNAAAVAVDARGQVTGVGNGTATVTAELGVYSASVAITASNAQLVAIAVMGNAAVDECGTATYTASGTYDDASVRDVTSLVTWSVNDPLLARMSTLASERNRLFSRGTGTFQLTASRGLVTSPAFPVTVADNLVSLVVAPDTSPELDRGATRQFIATGNWGATSGDVSRASTWSVANVDPLAATVATVLNGDVTPGLLTAQAGGDAVLSVTCGGQADTVDIAVVSLDTLAIANARPVEIKAGASLLLSLEGRYSNGTTKPLNEEAEWSAAITTATGLTVSNVAGSRGKVTAGAQTGLATISATVEGMTASVSVSVVP